MCLMLLILPIYLELPDNQAFHMFQNVEVEEECVDDRSVDDLLLFINGGNEGMLSCIVSTHPGLH